MKTIPFLLFAASVIASIASSMAEENLIPYGGFEGVAPIEQRIQDDTGEVFFATWRLFCLHDGKTASPRWFDASVSKDAAEGEQAFSFAINGSDDLGDCAIDRAGNMISVEPGATYKISFAAKDAGDCPQVDLGIVEWKSGGEQMPEGIFLPTTSTTFDLKPEYQTFSMTYTVKEGQKINLRFRPFDSSVGGLPQQDCTMLLDAIQMEKVPAR